MSDVLGDSDSPDDLLDDDDDEEFDDLDDLDAAANSGWGVTLTSPEALSIAALVLATVSLIGLLSTYVLVNAVALARPQSNSIFGLRVTAAVELGLGLLAILFAILAHGAARSDPEQNAHKVARAMAGGALLLGIVSIAESGGSLLISLAAHAASTATGG
jgi:hypothetical protein